jgi:hypothetical protein
MTCNINKKMSCFPKVGEFFMKNMCINVEQTGKRSRNICSPDLTLLGTCNHINYIGLSILK